MAKFEVVSKYKDKNINLPIRKTMFSAGYDFEVAEDIVIPSLLNHSNYIESVMKELQRGAGPISLTTQCEGIYDNFAEHGRVMTLDNMSTLTKILSTKPTLVPTGIKAQLDNNQYLELSVRSSCPLKSWLILANGVGIIDADYYNNPDNEGHIYFQIINLGPYPILLQKGDTIGQGIIKTYDVVEDDKACGDRIGGFGSSDEQTSRT